MAQCREFQSQELITARPMTYICNAGDEPRIVWRDLARVRELGSDGDLHVRWFDADLKESTQADAFGAMGRVHHRPRPNGTPIVRQMTFFARPSGFPFFGEARPGDDGLLRRA